MELWQSAVVLLSFWVMTWVGVRLARRNWYLLAHGSLADGSGTLMADEWRLSSEARAAIRQIILLVLGLLLVAEGVIFSVLSLYTFLFS